MIEVEILSAYVIYQKDFKIFLLLKKSGMRIRIDRMRILILKIWLMRIRILDNKNKITKFSKLTYLFLSLISKSKCYVSIFKFEPKPYICK